VDDFWVYGTDYGCSSGDYHWCTDFKQFAPKEVTWGTGQPNKKLNCVYMRSNNGSTLATADCGSEKRFLCDVRKSGKSGMATQQECLETWNVTTGREIRFV
jgi:hypothetical protein